MTHMSIRHTFSVGNPQLNIATLIHSSGSTWNYQSQTTLLRYLLQCQIPILTFKLIDYYCTVFLVFLSNDVIRLNVLVLKKRKDIKY